jgi:hypothetical protein
MRFLLLFVAWAILFVLSWPIALAVLVLAPIVWLLLLPFRLAGTVLSAAFALVRAMLFLPARAVNALGGRPS